jgi:hypothetical protein
MLPSDRPGSIERNGGLSQQMLVSAGRRDSRSWLFVDDIPKPAGSISPVGGNRGVGNEAEGKRSTGSNASSAHPSGRAMAAAAV